MRVTHVLLLLLCLSMSACAAQVTGDGFDLDKGLTCDDGDNTDCHRALDLGTGICDDSRTTEPVFGARTFRWTVHVPPGETRFYSFPFLDLVQFHDRIVMHALRGYELELFAGLNPLLGGCRSPIAEGDGQLEWEDQWGNGDRLWVSVKNTGGADSCIGTPLEVRILQDDHPWRPCTRDITGGVPANLDPATYGCSTEEPTGEELRNNVCATASQMPPMDETGAFRDGATIASGDDQDFFQLHVPSGDPERLSVRLEEIGDRHLYVDVFSNVTDCWGRPDESRALVNGEKLCWTGRHQRFDAPGWADSRNVEGQFWIGVRARPDAPMCGHYRLIVQTDDPDCM